MECPPSHRRGSGASALGGRPTVNRCVSVCRPQRNTGSPSGDRGMATQTPPTSPAPTQNRSRPATWPRIRRRPSGETPGQLPDVNGVDREVGDERMWNQARQGPGSRDAAMIRRQGDARHPARPRRASRVLRQLSAVPLGDGGARRSRARVELARSGISAASDTIAFDGERSARHVGPEREALAWPSA